MEKTPASSAQNETLSSLENTSDAWADRVAKWSFVVGVGIFILNMAVAWWVVGSGKGFISQPLAAAKESATAFNAAAQNISANQLAFYERMVEMDAHLKAMANQQTVMIIGMASSFSLLAIGFSLLIMGIRSAFKFSGQAGPNHQLVLSSASPGLLCFLLGAIIMVYALSRPIALQLGSFNLQASDVSGRNTASAELPSPITSEQIQKQLEQINP